MRLLSLAIALFISSCCSAESTNTRSNNRPRSEQSLNVAERVGYRGVTKNAFGSASKVKMEQLLHFMINDRPSAIHMAKTDPAIFMLPDDIEVVIIERYVLDDLVKVRQVNNSDVYWLGSQMVER